MKLFSKATSSVVWNVADSWGITQEHVAHQTNKILSNAACPKTAVAVIMDVIKLKLRASRNIDLLEE